MPKQEKDPFDRDLWLEKVDEIQSKLDDFLFSTLDDPECYLDRHSRIQEVSNQIELFEEILTILLGLKK
ncbi:MAG: hypothetical protein ACKPFF_14495, partial [Planktothrix sp.]